jgi:hypothetical protein
VPIEGVGVVHVITKPSDDPEYAETDVMLSRYSGDTPLERTSLTRLHHRARRSAGDAHALV